MSCEIPGSRVARPGTTRGETYAPIAIFGSASAFACNSRSARRYSTGITLRNFGSHSFQFARISAVRLEVARLVEDALVDHLLAQYRFELDHRQVAELCEVAGLVQHIGDAAGHAGREVAPGLPEHHDDAAGHVFAAMIARALDDGDRAGVAHGETLAGDAAEIAFARDRAVQHGVADDDALFRHDAAVARRLDDDLAAREALADIVVGFAFEIEGDALRKPRAEGLARGALEADMDGVVRKPRMAIDLGDRARQHRACAAVGVVDLGLDPHRRAAVQRGLQMVVLRLAAIDLLALLLLLPNE